MDHRSWVLKGHFVRSSYLVLERVFNIRPHIFFPTLLSLKCILPRTQQKRITNDLLHAYAHIHTLNMFPSNMMRYKNYLAYCVKVI